MKVLALLFVGTGALAYSCSGDDIFEEEEDVHSLAKRAMQTRGEDTGPSPNAVDPIASGSCSGYSNKGKCNVSVSWTKGYITRNTPEAKLTGSATCRLPNARGIKVTPTWEGYYGIHGTVDYTYDKIETYTDENGNTVFSWGEILLPEGKKPLVMSQDDVCYYPYMEKDGFARRIVIGEDGKPTAEMVMEDGSISTGPYDLIPILEDFIEEHPDFSYKGARAIIAFTGYEGILGYRTAASYSDSPNYEQDREQAAKVAQCLKDNGWELASHSWGHLWMGVSSVPGETFKISDERFYTDTDKWEAEVESLIGPTDIYIYPNGNDVADWRPYTEDNYRFKYLHSKGFRYFCNVDASKPAWIQKGSDHLRMARRNLDGYRLYEDMIQTDPSKKRLSDLFDASQIFDA